MTATNANELTSIDPTRCYWTTAHEAYDYWYVTTVTTVQKDGRGWRLVVESDTYRFENFQMPRYGSGLHPCFPLAEGDKYGLPTHVPAPQHRRT